MTQYRRGARIEYEAKKKLENLGYTVIRSAGSHSFFDLTCYNKHMVRFIQCKYVFSKNKFLPEKKKLEEIARICVPKGCSVELWVKRKSCRNFEIDAFNSEGKQWIEK